MPLSLSETEFRRVMRDHSPRLIGLAFGICRNRAQAEDVVQEAFVKLWQSPPDGPEAVLTSWLGRVVTNLSINYLRGKQRRKTDVLPEYSLDPALRDDTLPDVQIDLDDRVGIVEQALMRLPDEKRTILLMRVKQEMSYEMIAEALDIPIGTVMSRINRARLALMELVEARERPENSSRGRNCKVVKDGEQPTQGGEHDTIVIPFQAPGEVRATTTAAE